MVVDIEFLSETEVFPRGNGPLPTTSFEFRQTVRFLEDVTLTFKGTHNNVSFDLPSKIENPIDLLGGLVPIGTTTHNILSDIGPFIGWDTICLSKNSWSSSTYKAVNSPLTPGFDTNKDAWDSRSKLVHMWKAHDVVVTHDYSHMFGLFAQLMSKLDCYMDDSQFSVSSVITDLTGFKKQIENKPISKIAWIINSLFVKQGLQPKKESTECQQADDSKTSEQRQQQPWYRLFAHILKRPIVWKHGVVGVTYPEVFYEVPTTDDVYRWVWGARGKQLGIISDTSKDVVSGFSVDTINCFLGMFGIQQKPKSPSHTIAHYTFPTSITMNEVVKEVPQDHWIHQAGSSARWLFPAVIKDPVLRQLSQYAFISMGITYPEMPLVLPHPGYVRGELTKLLNGDPRFSTTDNLIKNKESLSEVVLGVLAGSNAQKGWAWHRAGGVEHKPGLLPFHLPTSSQTRIEFLNLQIAEAVEAVLDGPKDLGMDGSLAVATLGITPSTLLGGALKRGLIWMSLTVHQFAGSWSGLYEHGLKGVVWGWLK